MSADKSPGAVDSPTQFILPLPNATPLAASERDSLLERLDPACLVAFAAADGRLDHGLMAAAHRLGIPVLLTIAGEAPHRVGADGIYLVEAGATAREIADWRDQLGQDGMLVAFCGASRHAAMEAAERGVDAVAFGAAAPTLLDLVDWWAGLMEVPCIASGVTTPEQAAELARCGADFVMPEPAIWSTGGIPALEAIAAAIVEAMMLDGN